MTTPKAISAFVTIAVSWTLGVGACIAAEPPPQAQIPFANRGGIYNWQAENDRSLLIEDQHHQWYRATLMNFCESLNFADSIGFEPGNPSGTFDKFSSIRLGHRTCPLTSLVAAPAPVKKTAQKTVQPPVANSG